MDISDVRVKLIQDSSDRLKAVCTVTFDECFVVRDVKVVEGTNGLFVAMPSRKVSSHCPSCRQKNQLRATYCNFCGKKLPPPRPQPEGDGRSRMHKDLAHPITAEFREVVQSRVIAAYETELEQAPEPAKTQSRPGKTPPREREDTKTRRTAETTNADDLEEIEPLEISEYDALIADLKKSSGSSGHRVGQTGAPRGRDDRDERRRDHEPQAGDEPAVRSNESSSKPSPKPTPRKERPPVANVKEAPKLTPVEPARSTAVSESEVAANDANDDDLNGFGEGIL